MYFLTGFSLNHWLIRPQPFVEPPASNRTSCPPPLDFLASTGHGRPASSGLEIEVGPHGSWLKNWPNIVAVSHLGGWRGWFRGRRPLGKSAHPHPDLQGEQHRIEKRIAVKVSWDTVIKYLVWTMAICFFQYVFRRHARVNLGLQCK